jgi:hypothetical protein
MIIFDEQLGVHAGGEKIALTPTGKPEALKLTCCANPESNVNVIVLFTIAPGATLLSPPLDIE